MENTSRPYSQCRFGMKQGEWGVPPDRCFRSCFEAKKTNGSVDRQVIDDGLQKNEQIPANDEDISYEKY